ncbi:uncharacterized protein LOC118428027 [Branchiostoma floridae]|uniref:Uncharacterized protein LOC118428027 n=1 Tax=Branchiostoma floridae TaxID=7739 RepID=A0A9J7N8C6_BRAFL|nr:uncharacterized protein LOC118428027 [Branchiostoma floridae]
MDPVRPGPKISTGYLRGSRSLTGGKDDKKTSVGGDKRLSAGSRDRRASADVSERRSLAGVGRRGSSDDNRVSTGAGIGKGKAKQEAKVAPVADTPCISQEVCDRINDEIMSDDDTQKEIEELQEGLVTLRIMLTDLQDIRAMRERTRGVRGVVLGVADMATSLSRDQVVWVPFVSSSLIVLLLCQLVRLFFR